MAELEQDDQTLFALLLTFFAILVSAQLVLPARRTLRTSFGKFYLKNVVLPRSANSGSSDMSVSGLFVHPVKSLRAVSKASIKLDAKGFEGDRQFMLITPLPLPLWKKEFDNDEPTHRFLTQRQCPRLATVVAKIATDEDGDPCIRFSSHALPGETLTVPIQDIDDEPKYLAKLWDDVVMVEDMGDEASDFFRHLMKSDDALPDEFKELDVRLVKQSPMDGRATAEVYTPPSARLLPTCENPPQSLTDGFPILIATEASLAEVNRRIKAKGKPEITMARFRPNIVIKGNDMKPFEEDRWKVISIDGVIFHVVKGCPRCKQSCTDQINGHVYDEPLLTLREFRKMDKKNPDEAYFAQNVIPATGMEGKTISQGAKVQVLEWGEPVWGA